MLPRKYANNSLALLVIAFFFAEPILKGLPLLPPSRAASAGTTGAAEGVEGILTLTPGEPVARELSAREAHTYRITLTTGQYFRAVVEHEGADAAVTVSGPDGRKLVRLDCRRRAPTPVSLVAEAGGVYLLEVRSPESEQGRGRYELKVLEIRTAAAKDRQRVAAERLLAEAERLINEGEAESVRAAVGKYQEALNSWRAAGDRREEAYTLRRIGDAHLSSSQFRNALGQYRQALSLYRGVKDRRGEGDALNDLSSVHTSLGENRKALKYCVRALGLSQAAGNRAGEARALDNIGEAHNWSGKLRQALDFYRRALSIWAALGDRRGQAQTLTYLGYTYSDLGQTREAFDSYGQALSLWRAAGDGRGEAVTLTAIGRLYARVGESQEALDFFERAMRLIRRVSDPVEEARIFTGMAYVYGGFGENRRALEYYERAAALFRVADYPSGEAEALGGAGRSHHLLGDNQKALEYHQQALSIFEAVGDRRLVVFELKESGRVYDAQGDRAKALENYLRARSFYRAEKDLRGEADTLNLMGQVYEGSGQSRTARGHYERALLLSRKAEYRYGEAASLYNVARAERAGGDLDGARERMKAALEVVESLRAKVGSQDLRASYFASVRRQYEFYIDLLMELHKERPTEGFDVAAFEASERARARSLLETLAAARVGVRRKADPALLERERALRQTLNERAERRMRLEGAARAAEAAVVDGEIEELTALYREVAAQVRASSLEHTSLMQPQPLGLKAVQERVVDDDALLLEYSLGEERSHLWAVTRTSLRSYELPGRAEVEEAANRVRGLMLAPQPSTGETFAERQERVSRSEESYWREAAALGRTLLAPVAADLGTKRLLIVADGALQYIPFGALPSPGGGDADPTPLILQHEITYQPSASALATLRGERSLRRPAPKTVAVFADPVFEEDDARLKNGGEESSAATGGQSGGASELSRALRNVGIAGDGGRIPRLMASRDEAEAIAAAAPSGVGLKATGFEANKVAATDPGLGQYRIIHFATHGILDSEHPELSGLVLSLLDERGRPRDGFLRLNDIYNLDLPADMVVLSACNTGLGKDVKGEGLVGLARGFMYAGAERVLASLWKVDDEATAELMKHFYERMLGGRKSPAAALREAQIAVWRQKRWRSPYFWAAFELQGEYGGRIEFSRDVREVAAFQQVTLWQTALALAFALSSWKLYATRRRARRNSL